MGGKTRYRRACALLAVAAAGLLLCSASSATPPSNDSFTAANVLLPATGSRNGTTVDATKEAGEPNHADSTGGGSVWYRWTAPDSGTATFDTIGSGFDTVLAVYTGSSVDALTLVASNDDFLGWKWTSRLGFAATSGVTYYIAVDGYNDGTGPARGTFAVNWDLAPSSTSTQPNDPFASAVQIDGPSGTTSGTSFPATKEAGEPSHAGNAGGRSVWFRWTAPYDGTFTFTTDASQFNTLLAVYAGVDVGSLAPVAANDDIAWNNLRSSVTFSATEGTVYSIAIDGKKFAYSGSASGPYTLQWISQTAAPATPANDLFAGSQSLTGSGGSVSGSSLHGTKETGEPSHAGAAGGASVWYSWTAPSSGTADFWTAGSSFDTLLGVYTGSAVDGLTVVASNDNVPQATTSEVTFAAVAGTTYRIAVDGNLGAKGDVVLSWALTGGVPAPANDNFDQAVTLTGIGGIFTRSSAGATKEAGEPDHAGNPGGASVWYRWTAPGDGQWRFYTDGSAYNTLMAVYTGDSVDALTLIGSGDDVSAANRTSSVTFIARAQTTYWIAVDGYKGAAGGPAATGNYTFQWELLGPDPVLAPNDDFAAAWQTSGQSGSVTASNVFSTKEAGEPNHAGNPGGASVWFKWTAPSTGYVSWDTPGSSFDTLLAAYTGSDLANLRQIAANDDIANNLWWPDGRYRESYLSFIAFQGLTYYIAVDGKAAPGGSPARGSIFMEWWQNPPSQGGTLLAAGDVHASCDNTYDQQTGQLLAGFPTATVAAAGDLADPGSTDAALADCYGPSWGPYKSRTRPAVGNHEYDYSPTAAPYFGYFGSSAGTPGQGWYSYELGGWHIVVLNSNCAEAGGCDVGSPEYQWLQQDLASNPNDCTLAYWHHPLFASSNVATTSVKPFWTLLYQAGADVIINAHARQYERFAPMTPDGAVDTAAGIREFVVGTGGADVLPLGPAAPNSEIVSNTIFGVLKLALRPTGYDWQYLPVAGTTFPDSGHGSCSGGSAADVQFVAAPPAPTVNASLTKTGQYTVSWKPSADIASGATYTLYQRSTGSLTWTTVASGLTGTSYSFGTSNARGEGTWVYRVQASGGGKISDFSPQSAKVVVDKSAPIAPLLKPDRPAEYAAGGWWKGSVTVTAVDNGDAVLADGTPGSGVNPASLIKPVTRSTSGSQTVSDQVADRVGLTSPTASLTIKVDATAPGFDLKCTDARVRQTVYATFTAKDDHSGLATPPSGKILEDSSTKGAKTLTVTARDNVGNTTTKSCSYNVR